MESPEYYSQMFSMYEEFLAESEFRINLRAEEISKRNEKSKRLRVLRKLVKPVYNVKEDSEVFDRRNSDILKSLSETIEKDIRGTESTMKNYYDKVLPFEVKYGNVPQEGKDYIFSMVAHYKHRREMDSAISLLGIESSKIVEESYKLTKDLTDEFLRKIIPAQNMEKIEKHVHNDVFKEICSELKVN